MWKVSFLIKNVVFDMGGVLLDFNFQRTLSEYFPAEYHDVLNKEVFQNEMWSRLDRGTERAEDAIPEFLPKIPEETRELVAQMVSDFYPYMPPFPNMCDFIKRLKAAGYKVYLLSNATPRVFDKLLDIPALSLMDGLFVSCTYKLLKPQKEIYEAFCSKFSVKPEECFFIDDMSRNIEGAKNIGMKGFVFKAPDTTELEKALNAEGVVF